MEMESRVVEDKQAEGMDAFLVPATPGQQRFWGIDQLGGGDQSLNMPLAWSIRGPVQHALVQRVINTIVSRHEILRTAYQRIDGQLMQVIYGEMAIPVVEIDLAPHGSVPEEETIRKAILDEARFRLNVAEPPLCRVALIHTGPDQYVLTITLHHLACDGWSNGVLLDEFAHLYEDYSAERNSTLPDLPLQYADWSVWLQTRIQNNDFTGALEFWRQRLLPLPPPLEMPVDADRSLGRNQPGHIESLLLTPALRERMRDFCQQERITLYVLMLAGFELLLYKYTGQPKFLLGSPFANRTSPETEPMVGLFANPQFVPAMVQSEESLRGMLHGIRDEILETFPHQDIPFEYLVESLKIDRGTDRFQLPVYFVLQKAFMQPKKLSEIEIVPLRSVSPGAQFEIMMGIVERSEGIRLQAEYNSRLFTIETIRDLLEYYRRTLEAIVDHPDLQVSRFSLAAPHEEALQGRLHHTEESAWNGKPVYVLDSDGQYAAPGAFGYIALGNGEDLPTRTSQKVRLRKDGTIERVAASASLRDSAARRPISSREGADETETVLLDLFGNLLGQPVGLTDNFFEHGGTSLGAVRLSSQLFTLFGKDVPLVALAANPTVKGLAALLKAEGWHQPTQSIVPLQSNGHRTPIFCIYGVFLYYPLAEQFKDDRPVYGLYLPEEVTLLKEGAANSTDGILGSIPLQAKAYIETIRGVQPKGPYILAGESYGGVVAYEMAQQLRNQGEEVEMVVLLDSHAPGMRHEKPLLQRMGLHAQKIAEGGLSYLVEKVGARTKPQGGDSAAAPDPRQAARSVAFRSYVPQPYAGRVVLFRAQERNEFELDNPEDMMGWRRLATGEMKSFDVPGDHLGILKKPNVEVVGRHLKELLPG